MGLQDRCGQSLHPRATLIPGAHSTSGGPEMRAAASLAGSQTASISYPELRRLHPRREQSPARWFSGQARLQPELPLRPRAQR